MATEYININNNSNGLTSISTISIKSIVNYVLDDLGYVDLNNEAKGDFKARLEDEPKVTLKEGEVNVTLNLSFKNGLNALTLAKEIQKEVTEAFLNMTEYASFKVDVKIGRIY